MGEVGQREIRTQRRVVAFFQEALGYAYLGHWQDRANNRNVEPGLVRDWLERQGYGDGVITRALRELDRAASLGGSKTLYDANRETYDRLRYGVKVQPAVGQQTVTVWLIDWDNPGNNDFAIAEEVTVTGRNTKRPDLVLYVNGIALGVLELKRSTVSVSEGIRQNLDSQKPEFIRPFFATVQLVMAGNEIEELRYGVIETPEKYWLRWKENEAHPAAGDNPLLLGLGQLCGKERLLEIVHDFIVFDRGVKKICRHNQYFGVRAAQVHVERRQGGVIWHTQGSGKSLTMVWLAKWIREHITDPRVVLITDRTELDEQIEQVFKGVSEDIHRTSNGADLVHVLNARDEWLICSLIHKFGRSEEGDIDAFVEDIQSHLPTDFFAKGEIFVFVDECHRTQSGKLHRAMKTLLPEAMLIGFTGCLYIDKPMQDHGLFQAICRVNRLDGDDKEYGYIIDYKDLFRSLEQSIKDYTGEAFDAYDAADIKDLLKDRLQQGRERLEDAREQIKALCEPVEPPHDTAAYLSYFCTADSRDAGQLKDNEWKRVTLYKCAVAYLRAYADLANEMREAGYSDAEAQTIRAEVDHYEKVRQEVKLSSGDYIDLKMYEPAMRHLLDTYIRAEESETLSTFDDMTLVQLVVERGEAAIDSLPDGIRGNRDAVAETIENNVRRIIINEMAVQSEVLREDVRTAGRSDHPTQAGGPRLQGVPRENRCADETGELSG